MTRKRLSNDSNSTSKRTKKVIRGGQVNAYDDIDSIPSRSARKERSSGVVSATSSFGTQTIRSIFQRSFDTETSVPSSSVATSKNTSFTSDCNTSPEDDLTDYFTTQESPSESENEPDSNHSLKEIENRLRNIWPKFANESFSHAPLATTWELARLALHCGVNLADCDIRYSDDIQWHEQPALRSALGRLPAFENKSLPQSSGSGAWDLALKGFQSQSQAVTLSAELTLNLSLTARRFGADRFMEILIPSLSYVQKATKNESASDAILAWLTDRHYFLGRRWAAFYCRSGEKTKVKTKTQDKDSQGIHRERIFLFACNGDSFRRPVNGLLPPVSEALLPHIRTRIQLHEMLAWAIDGIFSTDQQMPKIFSRISLSLTRTWATVELMRDQIHNFNNDIGSDSPMNDGIGRISKSLATKIADKLCLDEVPCAFQARLGSAKGMWIISADATLGDDDWIVTYPSQRKWNCDNQDIHHRTFEVKEWSKEPRPATLNQQFIPVLEEQAIDPQRMRATISKRLETGLEKDLEEQKTAMNDSADLRLWLHQGGGSKPGGGDFYMPFLGGLPKERDECTSFLLDHGFDPKTCKFMQDLCWETVQQRRDILRKKMNIRIPCSAYLLMVVDFSSSLEENEVHVSFSTKFQVDGFCDTLLEGMEVLVARAPSHLPSDIQRVKVVSKPQLRHLKDVIVFSINGDVSLADKLSGGDYDGDRAWVCWDQDIVQNFRNSPTPNSDTDPIKLGHLQRLNRSMNQIRLEERTDDAACTKFLHESFRFNMQPSLLGKCTDYKERYCHHIKSVSRTSTIILSRMLGYLVDQAKQGFLFTSADWDEFRHSLNLPRFLPDPDYMQDRPSQDISKQAKPHILDYLKHIVAATIIDRALAEFDKTLKSYNAHYFDADLTELYRYYDESHQKHPAWSKVQKKLRLDIEYVADRWAREVKGNDYVDFVGELYETWHQIRPLETETSSELVQHLRQPYLKNQHASLWELLKASLTFKLFHQSKPKFVWQMAGRQLAFLKALAQDCPERTSCVLMVPQLYTALKVDKRSIESRRARRLAATERRAADFQALDNDSDASINESA